MTKASNVDAMTMEILNLGQAVCTDYDSFSVDFIM